MKQYWLFKSEPDCFSIDDLYASPKHTTSWSGVRNYQSRNTLRDNVKVEDEVLFYNSSSDPLGIAGICTVVRSGYPDPTQFDPNDQHYDPKSKPAEPTWYTVDVAFQRKLSSVLTLQQLKQTAGLEKMMVCQRGSRLSIQPVTAAEWRIIQVLIKPLLRTI